MSTGDDLLQAVIANPEDDTLRLVMADYLEEQGDLDRATFIRTQIALSRIPPRKKVRTYDGYTGFHFRKNRGSAPVEGTLVHTGERIDIEIAQPCEDEMGYKRYWHGVKVTSCSRTSAMEALGRTHIEFTTDEHSRPWEGQELSKRERELLKKHASLWMNELPDGIRLDDGRPTVSIVTQYRRGFAEVISCPLDVWIGRECKQCFGDGNDLAPPDHRRCPRCKGVGRVAAYGPIIVKQAPITEVRIPQPNEMGWPSIFPLPASNVWTPEEFSKAAIAWARSQP